MPSQAYLDGQKAYEDNIRLTWNPYVYRLQYTQYVDWAAGWVDAKNAYKKEEQNQQQEGDYAQAIF